MVVAIASSSSTGCGAATLSPTLGRPARALRRRTSCDLGHTSPTGPRAILAPTRSRGGRRSSQGAWMADDAARIAQLEAENASLRKREAALTAENVALCEKGERSDRRVTEVLEQQTATAEVLRVIASSPTELEPVVDAVFSRALRLSESVEGHIAVREGEHLRVVSVTNPGNYDIGHRIPLAKRRTGTVAVLERRVIHVMDHC